MIETFKPHSAYKTSSLAWLGQIPSHWTEEQGFAAFREKQEKNVGMREKRVLSLSYGRVIIKPEEKLRGLIPESFETYQIVNPGDLIIRGTDLQNDWTSLRVGIVRDRGIITSAYLCLRNTGLFAAEYAFLVLHAYDLRKFFYGLGSGLRQNLSFRDFRRLPFPVPPLEEQAAIVRFLDHANRRIDRYIRAKKKLIALLNEQKQAIIHRAVTRGLNPNAPMKDSGVPWLGQIPAHWELTPNSNLMRIRRKLVGFRHTEYKLLSLTKGGVVVRDMSSGGKFSNFWERSQEVRPGDLVFCLFDVEETPRTVGLSPHLGMISGDYTIMECADGPTGAFLECFYKAMDDRKLLSPLYMGLRKRIPKPKLLAVRTPIPPPDEQLAIMKFVDKSVADIDSSIERVRRELSLLGEYRTRVVFDVVTGQLDVREAASRLPVEEVEHEAPPDIDEDAVAEGDEEAEGIEAA